ncbi:LPXTG cell wall anchor domain-containing protein [Microbacterium sp. NPDC055442]
MAAATIAAALIITGPLTAAAQDSEASPAPVADADGYTPDEPTAPTLAGSTAVGECEADVPWINFSIALTDPDDLATDKTATMVLAGGGNTVEIPLGELVDDRLAGRVLWPGASVGSDGTATGWPGWEQLPGGEWRETDANFGWTRGPITAYIEVNPQLAVPLSYPDASPNCVLGPRPAVFSAGLPATGVGAAVIPLGIGGALVAIAGLGLLAIHRRRARA